MMSADMAKIKQDAQESTKRAYEAIRQPREITLNPFDSSRTLFDMVQNPEGWKFPTIPAILNTIQEAEALRNAIVYFAGGAVMYRMPDNRYHVSSKGYYHFIGA